MPKGMLLSELVVAGAAKRSGVKYLAANGATMENTGEKGAKFRRDGVHGISGITL